MDRNKETLETILDRTALHTSDRPEFVYSHLLLGVTLLERTIRSWPQLDIQFVLPVLRPQAIYLTIDFLDPVRPVINYELQEFDHTQVFFNRTEKPYGGTPKPEIEEAWDELLSGQMRPSMRVGKIGRL